MLSPHQQLRVAVIGNQDVAVELDGTTSESGQQIAASTVMPDAFSPRDIEADCLLLDTQTVDSWQAVLDEIIDAAPELSVVVVVTEAFESAIETAIEAGVDDYLPRSLCERRPSLVATRLMAAIDNPAPPSSQQSIDPTPAPEVDASPETNQSGHPQDGVDRDDAHVDRENESTYRSLFEGVSDGLVVHAPETGKILDCNGRFCEMTGYSRAELVGKTVDCVVASDENYSYEQARKLIRRTTDEGSQLFEWQGETKGGETFPVEVHLDLATVGDTEAVLASVRDITERKQRQRRLAAARDKRSILFENTPDPIMTVCLRDGQPHIAEVNASFEELFGFDAESIANRPISDLMVPDEHREKYEQLRDRALSGEPIAAEVRRQTTDGRRDFLLRGLPFEADGEQYAYVWYTDVTDRRERERALERERDQRSVLFENNPDPVLGLDFQGDDPVIEEVNPAFEDVFGFEPETVIGSTVAEAVVPKNERDQHDQFRKQAAQGKTIEHEAPRLTADGIRQFVFKVIQFNDDPESTDAYVWYTDVTERRRHEQAIKTLQGATERMQRADDSETVASVAVEAATEALGVSMAICWLHDDDSGRLEPTTATEVVDAEEVSSLSPNDDEYAVFDAGEIEQHSCNDGTSYVPFASGLLLPLGDHGLLAVGGDVSTEPDDVIRDVAQTLAEGTETALTRLNRAQEVRQSQRRLQAIIDRIDEAIFLGPVPKLDDTDSEPDFVSSGYEEIWGQSLVDLHESHEEGFFGTIHTADYEAYVDFIQRLMSDIDAGDPADTYSMEYRIERPDGAVRWVHSDFYPIEWADGPERIVIVSRDITDRKKRHRRLESFHDATAEMTTADSVVDASRLAVEAAGTVFDLPATAVYQYNEATATLDPRSTGRAIPDPAELPPLGSDDSLIWDSFVSEKMARLSAKESPLAVGPGDELLVFPLGGNGVLVVWRTGETFDTDAASILAATLEAALNRLRGERQLESRRKELEAQTERAQRLDAVAELTQRVEAAITTTSSREGIQEAVCAELADTGPFSGAWIAAAEVGTDRLTARSVDGIDRDYVDQVLGGEYDGTDPHPAIEAWQSGESQVVTDLVGSGRRSNWRQLLLKSGASELCAVPLAYGGITYGVLTILADDPGAFGEREMDVLSQLSQSIGYAMTAIERQRALESDDTVELEFEGQQMALPFAQLARETACQVHHERTVRRQDGSVSVYYRLCGDLPTNVVNTAKTTFSGEITVVSRQDGEIVIEREGSSWFGSLVPEHGGVLRRGQATTTGVTLLVELPQKADVRTIVERPQTAFPQLELTAKRHHRETASTPSEIRSQLQQRLTDRQYEAVETGHAMGYFEWPRENSGEEVADRLGITQPTVNKHIRLAEQKVFDFFFDNE